MKLKSFFSKLCVFIFIFSVSLLCASSFSASLAGKLNGTVCHLFRKTLSQITSPFSFSVFESAVIFSPVLIFLIIKYIGKTERAKKRFLSVMAILSILPSLYILTLAIPNKAESKVEISVRKDIEIKDTDVILAAARLSGVVNELSEYNKNVPTYSQIRDELTHAYTKISAKRETFPKPKPLLLSRFMSYAGILALYSFPTGEVNINTEIPEYMIPFTVAHEYAHCLGAASESEANFLAFLASLNSENEYIRYSGALCSLEYLLADLSVRAPASYKEIYKTLSVRVQDDMKSYSVYSEKYKNSFIYRISDRLNSEYLENHDKNGTRAYSAVAELVTAYIKTNNISMLRITYSKTTVLRSIEWDNFLYAAESRSAVKFPSAAQKTLRFL